MSACGQNKRQKSLKRQSGQLVLEYILLMLVAVSMATVAKNLIIGEPPAGGTCAEAKVLSRMVCRITNMIAKDLPGQ